MQRSYKGQTLVIIVSVMVIALAVGMSISTRFVKSLSNMSRVDLSSRALAIAEAGAEHLLSLPMDTLSGYINANNCDSVCRIEIVGTDGVTATADVVLAYEGNTSGQYNFRLDAAQTLEVSLSGYPSNTTFQLCVDTVTLSNPLAVSVLFISGSSGSYVTSTYLLEDFGCHTIPGKTNPVAVRIRSLYDDLNAYILPSSSATIPSQGILITSTGKVNDVVKKVTVLKTYNALPTEFDFVLYSKSAEEPLSN